MSVARTSISLPLNAYRAFLDLAKRQKITKSQMVLQWVKKAKRLERNLKLQAEFNKVATDPEYMKESQEWVSMANENYARNIAPNDAYSSKKG